ncbi:hypothetical protein [Falsiroseomonas sp.]|uniref:hypothetical protein n=1 Tax=Falsiroseomonas sp. TaxID=2870721 RepID=UPI003566A11E
MGVGSGYGQRAAPERHGGDGQFGQRDAAGAGGSLVTRMGLKNKHDPEFRSSHSNNTDRDRSSASEADIGILARNLNSSLLDLRLVSGFTIGLRTLGDGRGFEDTTLILGRILNNRYGLDAHCATATTWSTSIRYYGGHFACATGINPTLDRFGVRFSRQAGAYNNHNRHIFDGPNFELRQLDPNVAIPFLNETSGTAIIAGGMRMEACSPIAAWHTGATTGCEYEVAWAQTYAIGIDYTATTTRAGNAVYNRHRAPASRLTRLLAVIPNLRGAAFRHSNTEIGVEGACIIATSTTTETTMAALSWNGLDGIAATGRGLLLNANRGVAFVVQTKHAKEFALAHWLVGGADSGRLCVRCFDGAGTVRENQPQDVLASSRGRASWWAARRWRPGLARRACRTAAGCSCWSSRPAVSPRPSLSASSEAPPNE